MARQKLYAPLRVVGFVVLVSQFAAIVYTCAIAVRYWSGIGV